MTLESIAPEPEETSSIPRTPRPRASRWIKALKLTQKYSAIGIATYAGLHLTSTIVLPAFSVNAANSAFMVSRSIYQNELGEAILVYGSFGLHILSGLALHAIRVYKQYAYYGILRLGKLSATVQSGLFLTLFASLHFIGMRYAPQTNIGDSSLISLEYVTWSLQNKALQTIGSLGAVSWLFGLHSLQGAQQLFQKHFSKRTSWLIWGVFGCLTTGSMLALSKQPAVTGWIAQQYRSAFFSLT